MNKKGLSETIAVIKHKEFGLYLLLRFFVIFAIYAQFTGLCYYVYDLSNSKMSLGYIGLAELIPALLFSLPAGHIADKMDKQKMYTWCVLLYLFIAIGIGFVASPLHHLPQTIAFTFLYILIFLNGAARAFLAPISFSMLSLLTPTGKQSQAITLSTTAWYLGSILGPLAGGFLVSSFNMLHLSVFTIFCLCIGLACVVFIKSKPAIITIKKESIKESLLGGIKFVFSTKIILACLCLDLFAVLFGGAESMLPVFSKDILHVGASGFGWLRSAHGLGSLLLMLVLAFVPLQKKAGIKLLWSVVGFGLCMIGFAICKNFYLSFMFLFIGGMADCVSVIVRQSVLQQHTPNEIKGRVASVNMVFISSSNELGTFESALAASYFGLIPSVIFGGCMSLLVVILIVLLFKELLKFEMNK